MLRQSKSQVTYRHDSRELDVGYQVRLPDGIVRLAARIESWQPPPGHGVESIDNRKK